MTMTTFLQVFASVGGTAGFGAGVKVLLSWLSSQARKEGKLDQILATLTDGQEKLTTVVGDLQTRVSRLEGAAK